MSIQVNSPFLLTGFRPDESFTEDQNNYFYQLERVIQQIYRRTGGQIDAVDENEATVTSNAYVMSIANQAIHDIEEVNAYNYARHQARLDELKAEVDELKGQQSAITARINALASDVECINNHHPQQVNLDYIHEQLKEIEALAYGYNA